VHGRNVILSSRTIDVHVTALRKKLGELAGCVETVRGVGYRFGESLVAVE
jgi:DNA-binding response OmpR family regulator